MSGKETMYLLFDRKKFTMNELFDEETGYGGNFDEFMDGCHPGVEVYDDGEFLYAFNDGRIDPKKQFLVLR